MKAIRAKALIHWGLSINHFFGTKSRPALRIIPPTTLIGALAYPLARLRRWPENRDMYTSSSDRLRGMLRGVYYTVLTRDIYPFTAYAENTKIMFYKDTAHMFYKDAAPVHKLYSVLPVEIEIMYLVDETSAESLLGPIWMETLEAAAASIARIGAKESHVSVDKVSIEDAEITVADGRVSTRYTVPIGAYQPPLRVRGRYMVAKLVDWRRASIGEYLGKPGILVAQPETGEPVEVEGAYKVIKVGAENLVPWFPG